MKNTAIRMEEANKARTYLVTTEQFEILGYFTLLIKPINIPNGTSKSLVKKLDGLNKNATTIIGYLIGQLGKNDKYCHLIKGCELLKYAFNTIYECFKLIGIRLVFVECENNQNLISFYQNNKFKLIGQNKNNGLQQFVRTVIKSKIIDLTQPLI